MNRSESRDLEDRSAGTQPPALIIWSDTHEALDDRWLERANLRDGSGPVAIPAEPVGDSPLPAGFRALPAMARALRARFPGRGVFLLRSGLELPDYAAARLRAVIRARRPPEALVLPGSHASEFDPLAGIGWPLDSAGLDSLAAACGERIWRPIAWPRDPRTAAACLYLSDAGLERLAGGDSLPDLTIADDWYVLDPKCAPNRAEAPTPPAPLGDLRHRLLGLAGEGIERLPYFGLDGRPVTLHISHNWGGGVARWIQDFIDGDAHGHHLVLTASSDFQARRFGQWLELHALGPGRGRIRELALDPAIGATVTGHAGYADRLDRIVGQFGVGRVLVSSLIGHSLDALATGLPSAQVLHDYYPAWPLLDHDPLPYTRGDGPPHLDRALAEHARDFLFEPADAAHWQALARAWHKHVSEQAVRLIAPSRHVAARWQRLMPDHDLEIERIGHGFRPFSNAEPVETAPPADRRLHLLVLGRLNPGKGLGLLLDALPGLGEHARVTCLGAGRQGHRLFGRAGVDVLLDYDRDRLPELVRTLKPDAALFLSTVPETWNYALSEARSLGLVPIATNLGSFAERIHHDHDGILIEPDAAALVEAVAELARQPQRLGELRANLPREPEIGAMAEAYNDAVPARPAGATGQGPASTAQLEHVRLSGKLADVLRHNGGLRRQHAEMEAELARRARWAEMMERQFRERSRWAEQLETERRRLDGEVGRISNELQQATATADQTRHELDLVLASRSWRLTRPLRVVNRMLANARARALHNPLNWPRMAGVFLHHLRLRGFRQTLYLLQAPAVETPAPPSVEPVQSPAAGQVADPVNLEPADQPLFSVIVPVFNQVHFTAACLNSIQAAACRTAFEVIVVDDASTDSTAAYLAQCRGIRVLTNPENLGFIGACNLGAAAARGEFLVFLNNDTTVTDGWLEALHDAFRDDPRAGIVGARLVYPDGTLQEAGGIVFSDGHAWNYGRGEDPDRPEFNFVSEADYVSGACLAIRRERFAELGGFDSHYAPAYYEDTDLCFKVRAAGNRVIYQPACTVIHHEGATSGTDEESGTKRYQAVNREKFKKRWADALAAQPRHDPDWNLALPVRRHRHHHTPRTVLVIDAVTPMPDQDSGSVRLTAILEILRNHGFLVSFMPANLSWVPGYSERLQEQGIEVITAPWADDVEDWLRRHGRSLEVVLVSRHYVLTPILRLIRHHCPQARLIFDTVDLHFLREEREARVSESAEITRRAQATRRRELALVKTADITLVVSPFEQQLLSELVPQARVRVVSNIHLPATEIRDWDERQHLLFVGGFQHSPNIDAVHWFVEAILPHIREQITDIEVHIIGSKMPESISTLREPGVHIHGFVRDLGPFLRGCRISIAPLRFGAGVKGKVNQAMAHGMPVVATSCAAEGMYLEAGREILIADEPLDFAARVVRAYNDPELWRQLSAAGLENVRRHFSPEAAERALAEVLELEPLLLTAEPATSETRLPANQG